jgi:hypothetical protein
MGETMTETPEIPANPQLSTGFDRARKLSRILAFVLGLGIVLIAIALIGVTIYMASPDLQAVIAEHSRKPIPRFGWGKYVLLLVAAVPCFLALRYARRLFQRFAEGDVFSAATIGLMRTAALWITVAGLIPPQPLTLIIGMATYVAAYVMAEACRIADDNASIV